MTDLPRSYRKLPSRISNQIAVTMRRTKPWSLWSPDQMVATETQPTVVLEGRRHGFSVNEEYRTDLTGAHQLLDNVAMVATRKTARAIRDADRYVDQDEQIRWRVTMRVEVLGDVMSWPAEPGLTELPYRRIGEPRPLPLDRADIEALWHDITELGLEKFSVVVLSHPGTIAALRGRYLAEYFRLAPDERVPQGMVQLAEEI